jgi:hypothetical protein
VVNLTDAAKRLLLGRALRSAQLHGELLPKRLALPIFASDPLSSVAYATQEILLVLTIGGLAYLWLTPWVALAVVLLMTIVVASYTHVVRAYPSGGGSYEVASRNLGDSAGLVVASALLIDYVMTVAVSVAAGVDNIISAVPELHAYRVPLALGFVALLTVMNLRGVRESGRAFAVPTYAFIAGVLVMVTLGLVQTLAGSAPVAESAGWQIRPEQETITGLALVVLALRAFSSGCTALTGVEAISNGVPAFRKPKSANAATTMVAMGVTAVTMFAGVTALALISDGPVVSRPPDDSATRRAMSRPSPVDAARLAPRSTAPGTVKPGARIGDQCSTLRRNRIIPATTTTRGSLDQIPATDSPRRHRTDSRPPWSTTRRRSGTSRRWWTLRPDTSNRTGSAAVGRKSDHAAEGGTPQPPSGGATFLWHLLSSRLHLLVGAHSLPAPRVDNG